jgi:hypothetical protein
MSVCCECCVLSSRCLCYELITRPEESYRLWCVVVCDLVKLVMEEALAHWEMLNTHTHTHTNNNNNNNNVLLCVCSVELDGFPPWVLWKKIALIHVYMFPPTSIILQMFHAHSFIYHPRYIFLVTDSVTSCKTFVFSVCEIFASGLLNVNSRSVDLC